MANESDSKLFRTGPDGRTTVEDRTPSETTSSATALEEMSFSTHLLSLNITALMHLGEAEGVDEEHRDPAAARHIVDTLTMLAEKTQGNLTDEETKLLNALLYDLKLKIVKSTS